MPLSDTQCKTAKPKEKPYKLTDEKGLYLLVAVSGGKWCSGILKMATY